MNRVSDDDSQMNRVSDDDSQMGRSWPATSRGAGYRESAHDSTLIADTTMAWPSPPACEEPAWLQYAVPQEIFGVARHCSHARPDLGHSARCTVATMAYLYGSETADPPVSES